MSVSQFIWPMIFILLAIAMHYFQVAFDKYCLKRKKWFKPLDVADQNNYTNSTLEMLYSYGKSLRFFKWFLVLCALLIVIRESTLSSGFW